MKQDTEIKIQKQLIYAIILVSCYLLMSCKTSKQTETKESSRFQYEAEYLLSQIRGITISDSSRRTIDSKLSGHIRVWFPPNSLGNQYPAVDIDFDANKKEDIDEQKEIVYNDSTNLQGKENLEGDGDLQMVEVSKSDSRIIRGEVVIFAIILFIVVVIGIVLCKKRS